METNSITNHCTRRPSVEGKCLMTLGKTEHFPLEGTYIYDEKSCNHLSNFNHKKTRDRFGPILLSRKHVDPNIGCEYPRDEVPL